MLVLGYGYSKDHPPKFAAALFSSLSEGLFNFCKRVCGVQSYNCLVFGADVRCRGADYACTAKLVLKAVGSWLLPEGDSRYWQLDWCVPVCIEIFNFSFCSYCVNHLQLSYRLPVATLSRANSSALKGGCLRV